MTAQIYQIRDYQRKNPKPQPLDEMLDWWRQYFAAFGLIESKSKEPS